MNILNRRKRRLSDSEFRLRMIRPEKRQITGNQGFSLAEALVMTIVAGTLILPILGTLMQSAKNTFNFQHDRIARELAQKVQAEILAGCPYYDIPLYTHPEVPLPDGATLTVSVIFEKVYEMNSVATTQHLPEIIAPDNLWQYRIDIERTAGDFSGMEAASMTFITGYVYSVPAPGDLIYAAAPAVRKIYVIDPKTKATVEEFDTGSFVPIHLALHPCGDWLAIKSTRNILIMDIRRGSTTKGQCVIAYTDGSDISNPSVDPGDGSNDGTYTRSDRGILFRNDGKYLYFTSRNGGKLVVLEVPANLTSLAPSVLPAASWVSASPLALGSNTFLDVESAQNGMIYFCLHSSFPHKTFNTHTHEPGEISPSWSSNTGKTSHERAVASSQDGNELAFLYCGGSPNNYLGWVLSHAPTSVADSLMSNTGVAGSDHFMDDLLISPDNFWLFACSSDPGQGKHFYAFRKKPGEYWTSAFFDWNVDNNKYFNVPNADGITTLVQSPYLKELVADTKGNNVFFIDMKILANGTNPVNSANIFTWSMNTPISDLRGRIAEYAWIACADNTLKCLDIYGGQSGRIVDSKQIDFTACPIDVSVPSGGETGVVTFGDSTLNILDFADDEADIFTIPAFSGTNVVRTAFTIGRAAIVGVRQILATQEGQDPTTVKNGFLVYPPDSVGSHTFAAACGYALPGGFAIVDIVPMNRRDGAYILMQNTMASPNESALFWVEKAAAGGMGGSEGTNKYRIMYFWRGKYDGFPEGCPNRMALSADDTTLALYDPTASPNQKIRIYDLNNQRFPMQEGMMMIGYDSNTAAPPTFDESPKTLATVKQSLTRHGVLAGGDKTQYPLWFFDNTNFCDSARFFGYWYSRDQRALGISNEAGVRIIFNDGNADLFPDYGSANSWTDNSVSACGSNHHDHNIFEFSPLGYTSNHLQVEFFEQDDDDPFLLACGTTDDPSAIYTSCSYLSGTMSGGGATWNILQNSEFRALRFRPQLLKELVLDGSSYDSITLPSRVPADGDVVRISFHRDVSRCILFVLDNDTNDRLYGIGLFNESSWGTNNLPAASEYVDLAVSPDGRCLILASKNPNRIKIFDIAYSIPYTTNDLSVIAPKTINLAAEPLTIAVRPFNSFSSKSNHYDVLSVDYTTVPAYPSSRSGHQTVAMGPNGIYIIGGVTGVSETAQDTCFRFSPVDSAIQQITSLPAFRRQGSAVSYDGRVFLLGGHDGSDFTSSVFSYDPVSGVWHSSFSPLLGPLYRRLETDSGSEYKLDVHGAALTPYGMILAGGNNGSITNYAKIYHPHARVNAALPPVYGETIGIAPMGRSVRDNTLVTHFSRKDKRWYLFRVGGGSAWDVSDGKAFGIEKYDFETGLWGTYYALPDDRHSMSACSFGDEIYMFGGVKNASSQNTAWAFNPDTGKFRTLNTLPDNFTAAMAAVPAGSHIYLIDGSDGVGSAAATKRILKYRP